MSAASRANESPHHGLILRHCGCFCSLGYSSNHAGSAEFRASSPDFPFGSQGNRQHWSCRRRRASLACSPGAVWLADTMAGRRSCQSSTRLMHGNAQAPAKLALRQPVPPIVTACLACVAAASCARGRHLSWLNRRPDLRRSNGCVVCVPARLIPKRVRQGLRRRQSDVDLNGCLDQQRAPRQRKFPRRILRRVLSGLAACEQARWAAPEHRSPLTGK